MALSPATPLHDNPPDRARSTGVAPRLVPALDPVAVGLVAAGMLLLYVPTFWDWAQGVWVAETQGHELVILAATGWLLYRQRDAIAALPSAPSRLPGSLLLTVGLLIYVIGRSQGILRIELLSLIAVSAALLLWHKGRSGLGVAWFPLFFMCFAMPLPVELVLTLTGPLKSGASAVATWLLSAIGYPVGRSGVLMTIGQYQLLVNEACAGLQTMFTLEAMGLLYANLVRHDSALRNALLALMVVPVAFGANVVRVMAIALVTYHFGDAAGQGFLHGFAGLLLFLTALLLVVVVDRLLGMLLPERFRA